MYNGRDPETKKRKYLNQIVSGDSRDDQAHHNKMLAERGRGRHPDASKQTLNGLLDRWLGLCAKPRLYLDINGMARAFESGGAALKPDALDTGAGRATQEPD